MGRSAETVGQRIQRYRQDKGMTAAQLAATASLSKSYISELEHASDESGRGPSADVLYRIAQALGVAMSDLLGRPIITTRRTSRKPPGLIEFARVHHVPEADVEMLASIEFRGDPPQSPERWAFIYQAIRNSAAMDERRTSG
jgi:transcriptional regulator with XRE-family HTH domain